jgi:hypothetical protein
MFKNKKLEPFSFTYIYPKKKLTLYSEKQKGKPYHAIVACPVMK